MISPARKLSYQILQQIDAGRRFSDDALNSSEMERLDVRDRHLTTEIVYGTLRWRGLLDYVLAKSSSRAWQEVAPGAKILLRMSLYQMWRMDRIPDHALVHDAVELGKRELAGRVDRFLNGVLRHLARTRPWEKDLLLENAPGWVRVSMPRWLWKRYVARYGDREAGEYALALNQPPRAALRITEKEGSAREFSFKGVPSEFVPDAYVAAATGPKNGSEEGRDVPRHFQDEASQLVPHLLGDWVPGKRVWDACAAPGGKSAILSRLCGEAGQVIASDINTERIPILKATLKEDRASNAEVLVADAGRSAPFRCRFDAVLADVPCSGLGTLRRNPEIKWNFTADKLAPMQQRQKQILHSVSEAVKVGGRLLYSTCSTEPEENEEVVFDFLDAHPDFSLERPAGPPAIDCWIGKDLMVRTFPSTRLWDGFFAALLVRST